MKIIHAKMTFIHTKSFVYEHIHPCTSRVKSHQTLSSKLKVPNSNFMFMHKPSSHIFIDFFFSLLMTKNLQNHFIFDFFIFENEFFFLENFCKFVNNQ